MTYPGGKGNSFRHIINQIPPHITYIEPFAGGAAVAQAKQPAKHNILIDLDPDVIRAAETAINGDGSGDTTTIDGTQWKFINTDAIDWLSNYDFNGTEFIYADPPYVRSTRRGRHVYQFEMTDNQHYDLVDALKAIPCHIMISGYWSEIYADQLSDWNTVTFQAMTRGGSQATEYLWLNYDQPVRLHDYRYLGDNYRERERIKRKKQRWVKRLKAMPVLEQRALLQAAEASLNQTIRPGPAHHTHLTNNKQNGDKTMPTTVIQHYKLTGPATVTLYSETEMATALGISRHELQTTLSGSHIGLSYHGNPLNTPDETYTFTPAIYHKNILIWQCAVAAGGHDLVATDNPRLQRCERCPREVWS